MELVLIRPASQGIEKGEKGSKSIWRGKQKVWFKHFSRESCYSHAPAQIWKSKLFRFLVVGNCRISACPISQYYSRDLKSLLRFGIHHRFIHPGSEVWINSWTNLKLILIYINIIQACHNKLNQFMFQMWYIYVTCHVSICVLSRRIVDFPTVISDCCSSQ